MAKLGSAAPEMMRYVVMVGSVREGRMADRVTNFVVKKLRELKHEVIVFDPFEMQFPLLDKPIHRYSNRAEAPTWLRDAEKVLESAEGFVVVCSEYDRCLSPALSNMLLHFGKNVFSAKPASIVCYSEDEEGAVMGRSQLVNLLVELHASVVPTTCFIPRVHEAIDTEGTLLDVNLEKNFIKLAKQHHWYACALKAHRLSHGEIPNK